MTRSFLHTSAPRRRSLVLLLLSLLIPFCAAASDNALFPPNPNVADALNYIADPAGAITPEQRAAINVRIEQVREISTAEIGVAVVPGIGDYDVQEYSVELFDRWKLGASDRDNGLLIMIDTGGMQGFITTGYGLEGVLPDAVVSRIFHSDLAPGVKQGDVGAGVLSCVNALAEILTSPEAVEEIRSGRPRNRSGIDPEQSVELSKVFYRMLMYLAVSVFAFAMIMFFRDLSKGRGKDQYEKAMMWRRHLPVYWICAAMSAGAGLIFALLALWRYRRGRSGRRRCDTCGAKMNKLDEVTDNQYLRPSQDFEENLGTVDYDVWLCPKCGTVERFPFISRQTAYTECPECHTIAMCLKSDRILRPSTTRVAGQGVKTYECLFCHHRHDTPYRLPLKEDGAAAAAAAAGILGAMGRGGGGGFSGGGFGGGSTGGGGAGGSF